MDLYASMVIVIMVTSWLSYYSLNKSKAFSNDGDTAAVSGVCFTLDYTGRQSHIETQNKNGNKK